MPPSKRPPAVLEPNVAVVVRVQNAAVAVLSTDVCAAVDTKSTVKGVEGSTVPVTDHETSKLPPATSVCSPVGAVMTRTGVA